MAQKLSNLPLGAKVKFGKYSVNGETAQSIIWLIVAKNHNSVPAYPTNSVTLLTEKIVDLRSFDAKEPNSPYTVYETYGNNRYSVSNIDQWLNSDARAGEWYKAQHTYDQSPVVDYVGDGTQYADRPGFLNAFSIDEKNKILDTSIRIHIDLTNEYDTISRKVFLASATEIGVYGSKTEGAKWAYFESSSSSTTVTHQAVVNSPSVYNPPNETTEWSWWLRTATDDKGRSRIARIGGANDNVASYVYVGNIGIRPAMNLSTDIKVSDIADSDGCYTIVWNTAPGKPPVLNVPTTIYGGKSNSISWGAATDGEGDTITYTLECSVNGGGFTQVYQGASLNYAHLVPFGASTVTYRVKATDPLGESSEYTTSTTINVVNNYAPVISGTDSNLGVKDVGFTGTYTITDANSDTVTVTEAIDGIQIRALVATLGQSITYGITGNTWLALSNGSHTLTIRATDGIDTTVRTYTFTKLVDSFTITNSTPWKTDTMATRIMVVVTRNIPSTATFKVEVCNDGYDASPTWEDCTDAVKSGLVHVFKNTTKWSTAWGVRVRVTVERNGASGACYVSAIGGNFE